MSALEYLIAGGIAFVIGVLITSSEVNMVLLATLGVLMIIIGVVRLVLANLPRNP